MSLAASVSSVLGGYGQSFTIRKGKAAAGANAWTAGAENPEYYHCRGRVRHFTPTEIRGAIKQRDSLVILDPATVLVPPVEGDKIAVGTFTGDAGAKWLQIVNVYGPQVRDSVGVYRLEVRT